LQHSDSSSLLHLLDLKLFPLTLPLGLHVEASMLRQKVDTIMIRRKIMEFDEILTPFILFLFLFSLFFFLNDGV
jgi:hypothetical protein